MQDAGSPAEPIRPVVFTTDGLPAGQRLDAWNARFDTVNTISVPDSAEDAIGMHCLNWTLGPMLLSGSHASRARFERSRRHVRLDGLDHWAVRVLKSGRNRLQLGDARHDVGPGEPILFSLDQGWICDWSGCEWVSLCLPRDSFPDISAGFAALGTGPMRLPGAPLLADFMLMLERHVRQASPDAAVTLAEATPGGHASPA